MPMTTRTRRARARRAAAQIDSDVEMETEEPERQEVENRDDDEEGSNVDVEAEPEGEDNEEDDEAGSEEEDDGDGNGDGDDDDEDEQDEEMQSEADEPVVSPPKATSSRLKIRLKMPAQPPSRYESPLVESEDSISNDSQPSATRPMTTRQAVLASVLDSSHVSLSGSRSKKAPLNENELALRREETARKRKNLTEKKLEDEKAETINRLLRKQSRPRKKRTTAQRGGDMDDVAPSGSVAGTRSNSNSTYNPSFRRKKKSSADDEDQEEEAEEDGMEAIEDGEEVPEKPVEIPTMYRWISTSRVPMPEGAIKGERAAKVHDDKGVTTQDKQMRITFSIPITPSPNGVAVPSNAMEADDQEKTLPSVRPPRPTSCAAPGCTNPFRYRLVKDWTRGACGISCLKILEAGMHTAA